MLGLGWSNCAEVETWLQMRKMRSVWSSSNTNCVTSLASNLVETMRLERYIIFYGVSNGGGENNHGAVKILWNVR